MMELTRCEESSKWNQFLENQKEEQLITIAHNPCLGKILAKTFGYESHNMWIKKDDKIVGVLPKVKIGAKWVSMPHFSYGGPVLDLKESLDFDLHQVLNNRKFEARSFSKLSQYRYSKKITSVVKLKPTVEEQFAELKSGFRRKIRKAEKLKLKAVCGGSELLDDFYTVYAKKMLEKGSPPFGKSFFKNLLEEYEFGLAKIFTLYDGTKPVAVGFTLCYLGFNEMCWVSTDRDYDKQNVNSLLYWTILKESIERDCIYFSMGRSTKDSGNHHYKKQWRPMEIPIFYNYSEPIG
ncbi:unnamed protein product, partial [Ectocarpus sp. 12 AP-2014]